MSTSSTRAHGRAPACHVNLDSFPASWTNSVSGACLIERDDGGDILDGEAFLCVLGDEGTCGIAQGQDGRAKLDKFERCVLGYVARASEDHARFLESGFVESGGLRNGEVLEYFGDVVDEAVTGGFGSDVRAAEGAAFSGEDT